MGFEQNIAERHVQDDGLALECRIVGQAPVQADGRLAGHPFYFRARHSGWSFTLCTNADIDPAGLFGGGDAQGFFTHDDLCGYELWGDYGTGHDASYMPYTVAERLIRECAVRYLAEARDSEPTAGAPVTEVAWLNAADACSLLHQAREVSSERKYRLAGIALARHLFPVITHPDLIRGLEVAEQLADGVSNVADVDRVREFFAAMSTVRHYEARGIAGENIFLASLVRESLTPRARRSRVIAYLSDHVAEQPENPRVGVPELRDIFGNPFRPVGVDPTWRSESVITLAAGIYSDRAFDRLPILADALEEAGCDAHEVLTHCRGEGPHARGCWVVDSVLGR